MLWGSTRSSLTYIILLTEVTLQQKGKGVSAWPDHVADRAQSAQGKHAVLHLPDVQLRTGTALQDGVGERSFVGCPYNSCSQSHPAAMKGPAGAVQPC